MPKKRRASDASASSEHIEDFLSEKLLRKVEDNIFARRTNKCDKAVREGQKVFQELEGKLKDVQRGYDVAREKMYADFTAQHLAGRKNLVGSFSRLKELDASIQAILAEIFAELDKLGKYKEETSASRAMIIEAERSARSLHKAIEDDTVGQSTAAPAPPILPAGRALKQNPDLCVKANVDVSKFGHTTKRKKPRTTNQTLVNSD